VILLFQKEISKRVVVIFPSPLSTERIFISLHCSGCATATAPAAAKQKKKTGAHIFALK
jgi:hypothetical protein